MKKLLQLFLSVTLLYLCIQKMNAQVGINTDNPDASAVLDIVAKNNNKGLLIPRIALTGITDNITVPNPTTSLLVYNTTTNVNITKGFYYWDGLQWLKFTDKAERLFYGNTDPIVSPGNLAGDIYVNQAAGIIFAFDGTNWISQMSGTQIQSIKIIATNGQTNFTAPWPITTNNTKVYRNGINIEFTVSGGNTIIVETDAVCYVNDEIKIYRFL